MPTASVNGIDIAYTLEGDGEQTVVLVNGLADEKETWAYQTPALLEAGYRVLTFDNRGVGATSKPAGPYTAELLADDAKALVDELGITGFHLMGVSMGGMIVQEYALKHPGDLKSVTMASVGSPCRRSCWRGRRTSSSPPRCPTTSTSSCPARSGRPPPAGTAASGSTPTPSTPHSSSS
jgi:pimeloyl-ACP methyl ester carboxylesterase